MTSLVEMTHEAVQDFFLTTMFVQKKGFLFCVFIVEPNVAKIPFSALTNSVFFRFLSDLLSSDYVEIHYEDGKPVLSKVKLTFLFVQNNACEQPKMFSIVWRQNTEKIRIGPDRTDERVPAAAAAESGTGMG